MHKIQSKMNVVFFGAGHYIRYRRQLSLWETFTLQMRFVGCSEEGFYLESKFIKDDFVHATVLSKACGFEKGKGIIKPEVFFANLGLDPAEFPTLPQYAKSIIQAEKIFKDEEKKSTSSK